MQHRAFPLAAIVVVVVATLWLAGLAGAASPAAIVTGLDAGWPEIRAWEATGARAQLSAPWGEFPFAESPYPTYEQGVRVAVGDVNGDGRNEIVTAPGRSGFTELKVFDGRTYRPLGSLLPFKDGVWYAGAYVSTGDTNGDGRAEIVEGLDAGCCTTLHVLDALSGDDLSGFFPYGDRSEVGARVASADVNGDGKAEILAVPLGASRISAYAPSGGTAFRTLEAFNSEAIDRTAIAAGDLVGDARAEVVAAAATYSGAEVKIIDVASGATRSAFYPYGGIPTSSLEVALGDVNGDGRLDVVLSAVTSGGTEVKAIDTTGKQLADFYVLDPAIVPGASLAAGDLAGDGRAEIVLGGGPTHAPWPPVANGPDQRVAVYEADGTSIGAFTAYPGLFQGGVRVALADLNGDQRPEMVTAPGPGAEPEIGIYSQQWVSGRDRGTRLGHFLAFETSFRGGVSVATGDVNGDGRPEIVTAAGKGHAPEVRAFDAAGRQLLSFLAFDSGYTGGLSVAAGDLNADGRAEIVVGALASPARIRAFDGGAPYGPVISPFAPEGPGVQVGVADLAGDGHGVVLAGAATGENRGLFVVDPLSGAVRDSVDIAGEFPNGIRVGGGDLDGDGRDEIVVAPGFGGDGVVRVLDRTLREILSFRAYDWNGAGMNVAVATRIGFPIAAEPRTVRFTARRRATVVVARFRDAAGSASAAFRSDIRWGDGTFGTGRVLSRGNGVYDVRATKRYARPGRYSVTVTLSADRNRSSIARGRAIVRIRP
jgi:hypothetical protein